MNIDYDILFMLKKDVKSDINDTNPRIYQSIKALSEYAIKIYLYQYNDDFILTNNRLTIGQLLSRLKNHYRINFDIDNFVNNIVKKRNDREHEPNNSPKTVGHLQVKKIILCYNDLIRELSKVFKYDIVEFYFNEDVFFNAFMVKAENKKNNKEVTSEEMMSKMEVKRLRDKLKLLENELKSSKEKDQYKIRSEIIATKNNIKVNDKKLISNHTYYDTYRRMPVIYADYYCFMIGLNKNDPGFRICGLPDDNYCIHPRRSIYAIIYGILRKSSIYKPSQFIFDCEKKYGVKVNYNRIIRYQLLYLVMIKKNIIGQQISINLLDGDNLEFKIAIDDINNYVKIFSELTTMELLIPIISYENSGIRISLQNRKDADLWIEDLPSRDSYSVTSYWFDNDVIYNIDESNRYNLRILLRNIFYKEQFKEGQEEVIIKFLNKNSSGLCVMPTNGGKSLIYYFVSLLSPNAILIVEPTDLLIKDQIRNLYELHNIDDCDYLDSELDYSEFILKNKLNFVRPEIFMNYSFIVRISQLNNNNVFNKIVMDEMHCASNWSHDYRPAYLMISKYIMSYLPRTKILGYTATTSVLISKDILEQFQIDSTCVYEPINLKREDIHLNVIEHNVHSEIIVKVDSMIEESKDKILVFTKNGTISKYIFDHLSNEAKVKCDVYADYNVDVYNDFVSGYTNVLITDNEMSIGINIPSVNSSIHIGYPYSRNHFIQEAGRIAREDNCSGVANIIVRSIQSLDVSERRFLDRSIPIEDIIKRIYTLNQSTSDIYQSFIAIMGHVETLSNCKENTKEVYAELLGAKSVESKDIRLFCYQYEDTDEMIKNSKLHMQVYLMILHNLSLISEWFIEGDSNQGTIYRVKLNTQGYNVSFVKNHLINYLRKMDVEDSTIINVKQCVDIENLISVYIEWYYYSYLNYHREQFINMIQMVERIGKNKISADELEQNFSLSLDRVGNTKKKVLEASIGELICNNSLIRNKDTTLLIEKCLEDGYNIKFDLVLLCIDAIYDSILFTDRMKRIIDRASTSELVDIYNNMTTIYGYCKNDNKIIVLDYLCFKSEHPENKLEELYEFMEKDKGYYLLLTKILNRRLRGDVING